MNPKHPVRILIQSLQRFRRCVKGVAAIEFAVCINMLIIILIGMIDITQYALNLQKAEKTVHAINDVVSQLGPFSPQVRLQKTTLTGLINRAVPSLMAPYTVAGTNSSITLSDVIQDKDPNQHAPTIWQFCGNSSSCQSNISPNNIGVSLNLNDEVVVVEMFMQFIPPINASFLSGNSKNPISIYKRLISVPRNGSLATRPS